MKAYNINFKGYDNILSAFDVPTPDRKRVSLITMRLNDEGGHKDLTELRKILKMQGYPLGNENEDIVTLSYVDDTLNKKEALYFNNKKMYWGDELRQIEEKYIPELISKNQYRLERDIHMKQYTLLANLTSRIMYEPFDGQSKDIYRIIANLNNILGKILKDSDSAFDITNIAALKKFNYKKVAEAFNNGICRTMEKFFEVR